MSSPEKPQPPVIVKIIIFLALVLVVSEAMYHNMPVISLEVAEKRLERIRERFNADAARAQKQVKLTHGNTDLLGWGYDKYAAIYHLALTLKSDAADGPRTWALLAPSVTSVLDPIYSNRQIFRILDTLNIMQNGATIAVATFGTPIRFGFMGGLENDQQSVESTIRLPSQITITPEPSSENAKPAPFVISYDGSPEITMLTVPAKGESNVKFEVRNVILDGGEDDKTTIGALASELKEKANADKRFEGTLSFTVSDYTPKGNGKKAKTCSLTTAVEYTADQSQVSLVWPVEVGNAEMKLTKLVIACDDFGVKMSGAVARHTDDPLLSGDVSLSIENVKAFLASSLISDKTRSELTSALPKIAGQSLDSLTSLSVIIKRDRNGALQVGKASGDDINVSLLTDAMQLFRAPEPPPAPAPVETKAEKKKPAKGHKK